LLTSGIILAQSTYGTLTGTVTDQSSAIIRSVKVEAENQETKVTRSVLTDERRPLSSGESRFRFLHDLRYSTRVWKGYT
jgi:hypothetical protein